MDTSDFIDECVQLKNRAPSLETAGSWIKTAEALVNTFKQCAVGVTTVLHHEMREAIEAFTRLNTEGRRMTPDQIFFALTYHDKGFNLASAVDRLIEDILTPRHYGDINKTALLRVILAALERDIYSRAVDWRKLVEEEEGNLEQTLDACSRSLEKAMDFLHTRIGASSQKTLPYALQLVLLSEFFRCSTSPVPSQKGLDTLDRWFWVSSFTGAFMVGSSARFNDAVDSARQLARGEEAVPLDMDTPALPLPRRFHSKAARVRAFFLFLKSLGPRSPSTGKPLERVLDNGFQDSVLLFRQEEKLRGDIANRVLLGIDFQGDPLEEFRRLAQVDEDGPDIDCSDDSELAPWLKRCEARDRILKSHSISKDAWQALLDNDAYRFVEERRKTLWEDELAFMKEKGVTPPKGSHDGLKQLQLFMEDLPDDSED